MTDIFKALNDKTRRDILSLLKETDMNAGEIADHFNISKPSISHHLDLLKRAELVSTIKEGQFIIYSINTTVIDELFQWIYNLKETVNETTSEKRNPLFNSNTTSDNLHSD